MEKLNKNRVLLSMSGGIDSSVAAMILLKQGYEVVGVTYRTWDSVAQGCFEKEKGCCTINSIMEAKKMAQKLGFEHHFLDLREPFKNSVIKDFIDEYLAGRTPNPCVVCNASIKWGEVLKMADSLGCQYIATGHYAQISEVDGDFYLKKGVDTKKDQTYFLWRLPQEVLKRTIFPLGTLTKPEVRQIALENGFEKLSKKAESQEICFIPDNDYRLFLKNEVKGYEKYCKEGYFIDNQGNILGRHNGYPAFTVGQRKGLNVAFGTPKYVAKILPESNAVVLADREELETSELLAKNCVFTNSAKLGESPVVEARIRYRSPATEAQLSFESGDVRVKFSSKVWGVAPGQSVVFYQNDLIVGGGIIGL
ncbi:MAG: tRNA 2-thiouridine(34) synthase MnmA [Prevotellaceae bacterium]|jgi:tRNA-specific 2-thiouridylase|nr:tRNA 2-thiouridine(34) synthase MnmA [Prevotellaceae bacterium]